jgi:superfamily II DNA or RNA helicase
MGKAKMQYQPRDYQIIGVNYARDWVSSAGPGDKLLLAAPTGTGKSVVEILIQQSLIETHQPWIITPSIEIIRGLLEKLQYIFPEVYTYELELHESESSLIELAWALHITTPVRFRNAMLAGIQDAPKLLIMDEGHHSLSNTTKDIDALAGYCPAILLTATPYRGTLKGSAEFRKRYGEPVWLIDYPEAADRGYITIPDCKMLPCIDDDIIEIENGEFVASRVESIVADKIEFVADYCKQFVNTNVECIEVTEPHDVFPMHVPGYAWREWDRPTMLALPSRETAKTMARELNRINCPSVVITGESSHKERQLAFQQMAMRKVAVCQVNVVSEGVDIPELGRLIDLQPTLSPVRWVQLFGRVMRPKKPAPEYICTNRNLFRHGYILDGALPPSVLAEAASAFPGSTIRGQAGRAVGLESLGRLRAASVPYVDGTAGQAYFVSTVQDNTVIEYAAITHPCYAEILWARKQRTKYEFNRDARWLRCDPPDDLTGFASIPAKPITDKQKDWWKRSAKAFGLNPDAEVDNKTFQALPVFSNLRWTRFKRKTR